MFGFVNKIFSKDTPGGTEEGKSTAGETTMGNYDDFDEPLSGAPTTASSSGTLGRPRGIEHSGGGYYINEDLER